MNGAEDEYEAPSFHFARPHPQHLTWGGKLIGYSCVHNRTANRTEAVLFMWDSLVIVISRRSRAVVFGWVSCGFNAAVQGRSGTHKSKLGVPQLLDKAPRPAGSEMKCLTHPCHA